MQDFFRWQTLIAARAQQFHRYTSFVTPLGKIESSAVVGNERGFASVIALLACCGPSAIFRRIAEVIVDTVEAVFDGWTRPHVGIEVLERVQPTFADCYVASAVSRIGAAMGIGATPFHQAPDVVFACFGHAVLDKALCDRLGSKFALKATAALGFAPNQTSPGDDACVAALAEDFPSRIAVAGVGGAFGATNDSPSAKLLTCHINGTDDATCDRIMGHREPPVFSVTRAGTFAALPAQLIAYPQYTTSVLFRQANGAWTYGT